MHQLPPPYLPTLKAYPTREGGRFIFSPLKSGGRLNLKVPGAICISWLRVFEHRGENCWGAVATPFGELGLIKIWDFSRFKLFVEWFYFKTGSCWPFNSNFAIRKCTSVLNSQIFDKTYCWLFLFKSHFGVLCGAFCNISFCFRFTLTTTTVFKSTQNGRVSPFIHSL